MKQEQVKSRDRVVDFGEVYTNEREVNAMLDLVMEESYKVDSKFLEPAAGNGNFLVAILDRKLKTVVEKHNDSQDDYERYVFTALSNIYAIDILEDNCEEARERLFVMIDEQYRELYADTVSKEFLDTIEYILSKNIIVGDGLTGLQVGKHTGPIVFSEWNMEGYNVKRKDFTMNDMVAHGKRAEAEKNMIDSGQNSFMSMLSANTEPEPIKPIKEYELTHFKEAVKYE